MPFVPRHRPRPARRLMRMEQALRRRRRVPAAPRASAPPASSGRVLHRSLRHSRSSERAVSPSERRPRRSKAKHSHCGSARPTREPRARRFATARLKVPGGSRTCRSRGEPPERTCRRAEADGREDDHAAPRHAADAGGTDLGRGRRRSCRDDVGEDTDEARQRRVARKCGESSAASHSSSRGLVDAPKVAVGRCQRERHAAISGCARRTLDRPDAASSSRPCSRRRKSICTPKECRETRRAAVARAPRRSAPSCSHRSAGLPGAARRPHDQRDPARDVSPYSAASCWRRRPVPGRRRARRRVPAGGRAAPGGLRLAGARRLPGGEPGGRSAIARHSSRLSDPRVAQCIMASTLGERRGSATRRARSSA